MRLSSKSKDASTPDGLTPKRINIKIFVSHSTRLSAHDVWMRAAKNLQNHQIKL